MDLLSLEPVGGYGTETIGLVAGSVDNDTLPHWALLWRTGIPAWAVCPAEAPAIISDGNFQQ